jgi:hypothetical protein
VRQRPVPAQLVTNAGSVPGRFAEQRGRAIVDEDVTRLNIDETANRAMEEHWSVLTGDRVFGCWMVRQSSAGVIRLKLKLEMASDGNPCDPTTAAL